MKWGRDGNEFQKMDNYFDKYDDKGTVVMLKFNKRSDIDNDALLHYIRHSLGFMDYMMKDLEIEIK
jgi:hypothetical protein